MKKKTFEITEQEAGMRLDKALAQMDETLTRTHIKTLIESGDITARNKPLKPSTTVKQGDLIEVVIPPQRPLDLDPVHLGLDIIYQDDDLLVVNKPSGLIVHPSRSVKEATLVHGLLAEVSQLAENIDAFRPGIVHRIDKDTSGLLVVAKTKQALLFLQKEMQARRIDRQYIALVEGVISHEQGKIDAPIGRSTKNRKQMAVNAKGRPSVTRFNVLERFEKQTLITCRLESGRTHQIRVHLKYIGHPVYGDPVYGYRRTDTQHGQFLHAKTLGFQHPTRAEKLYFEAPLPDFFAQSLTRLRQGSSM